jgi:hypothetical protein
VKKWMTSGMMLRGQRPLPLTFMHDSVGHRPPN